MRWLRCTSQEVVANRMHNWGIWKAALNCIVFTCSVSYAPQLMQEEVFETRTTTEKITGRWTSQKFQQINFSRCQNGLLELDLSKLTFGFLIHQTHLTVPGWPPMSVGCGGLKEASYHVHKLTIRWIIFLWRLLSVSQCYRQWKSFEMLPHPWLYALKFLVKRSFQ